MMMMRAAEPQRGVSMCITSAILPVDRRFVNVERTFRPDADLVEHPEPVHDHVDDRCTTGVARWTTGESLGTSGKGQGITL
jgi:hypothetical protein